MRKEKETYRIPLYMYTPTEFSRKWNKKDSFESFVIIVISISEFKFKKQKFLIAFISFEIFSINLKMNMFSQVSFIFLKGKRIKAWYYLCIITSNPSFKISYRYFVLCIFNSSISIIQRNVHSQMNGFVKPSLRILKNDSLYLKKLTAFHLNEWNENMGAITSTSLFWNVILK